MKKYLIFAALGAVMFNGVAVADIPSVDYVGAMIQSLQAEMAQKANDDAVVHLNGTEEISGDKTFAGVLALKNAPADNADDNGVATTAWTNDRVDDAAGKIPVGSADATVFTKIWIEE